MLRVDANEELEQALRPPERKLWRSMNTPRRIQEFIDTVRYRKENDYICPLTVLRRREAHCFDGTIFAAAALRRLGYEPRVLYLIADKDDHHMLALYRQGKFWGALSKSNFATIGSREPVYRSLRELVMSYFDLYFNIHGYKGLRSYVGPLSLRQFDRLHWTTRDAALDAISDRLDWLRPVQIVTRAQVRRLERAGTRIYRVSTHDADMDGLYRP